MLSALESINYKCLLLVLLHFRGVFPLSHKSSVGPPTVITTMYATLINFQTTLTFLNGKVSLQDTVYSSYYLNIIKHKIKEGPW